MFYILDEGSRVSPQLPSDWKLVARDAFNGVLLWKHSIDRWHNRLWPLKSGPASLPRRLVAEGEVVYATLGIQAPVSALDAASGETRREYAGTAGAEEIVYKDGVLLVLVNRTPVDLDADLAEDPEEGKSRDSRTTYSLQMARIWAGVRSRRWTNSDRVIRAFDAKNGRQLWEKAGRVIPLTSAADSDNAYCHDGEKIVAIDLSTGDERWTSEPVPVWQGLDGRGLQSWFAPTLVVYEDTVLFAGAEKMHMSCMGWGSKDIGQDTMTAFSAKTGEKLWTADHPYSGYNSPEDLFVAGGSVWTGVTAKGNADGRYTGRNLGTGEIEKDFPPTVNTFWFHHRCYRAKATDKYVLCSRTRIEFVDIETGEWTINHWVRGGRLYGIMPSNGLISFQQVYDERFQAKYRYWRPVIQRSVEAFLKCGDLQEGFARVRCPKCKHEMFVAYSCKQRCTCPSCHQKRSLLTTIHVAEEVCFPVAHRQVVLTLPKRLRPHTRSACLGWSRSPLPGRSSTTPRNRPAALFLIRAHVALDPGPSGISTCLSADRDPPAAGLGGRVHPTHSPPRART